MLSCKVARCIRPAPLRAGAVLVRFASVCPDYIMTALTAKLRPGKSEKDLADFWKTCVEATRQEGDSIVDYQMYYHAPTRQTQCFEYYLSSEGVVKHQRMSGEAINAAFIEHLEPQPPMTLCGRIDDDTKKLFEMWPLQYFTKIAGSSDRDAYRSRIFVWCCG